jgi:aromatic-L-amino-acid decarboxylase
MSPEEFRRHGHAVVDQMADYLAALPGGPVWQPVPQATRRALAGGELGAGGTDVGDLLAFARTHVLPYPFGNGHPRFFGWANPEPALPGVLAELMAAAMNPSVAGGDQAAVHLERCAVRWVAELAGYPGDGVLVSGGAAASLTALTAARHRAAAADGWDDRADGFTGDAAARLVLYVSDETHSTQRKAARLLGLGDRATRVVPTDAAGALVMDELVAVVRADREAGLRPFCAVATAGIVATGAIDPLAEVAALCAEEGMWFHVDGSLGGFGVLDPALAPRYAGMDAADSLSLDPHKWLGVPIDCATVLVRDLDHLRDAFSLVPSYLRARPGDQPWFSEYVFDQTRPFRALKLWMTLAAAGRDALAARITRSVALARRLADRVAAAPELELLAEPVVNVVAFRVREADEATNHAIPLRLQAGGEVFLTGARVAGREAIRACVMHGGTTEADIDRIVPAVLVAASEAGRP